MNKIFLFNNMYICCNVKREEFYSDNNFYTILTSTNTPVNVVLPAFTILSHRHQFTHTRRVLYFMNEYKIIYIHYIEIKIIPKSRIYQKKVENKLLMALLVLFLYFMNY